MALSDKNQDWTDYTGKAYRIKYEDGNGKTIEVFKGSFHENHYIEGCMIRANDIFRPKH